MVRLTPKIPNSYTSKLSLHMSYWHTHRAIYHHTERTTAWLWLVLVCADTFTFSLEKALLDLERVQQSTWIDGNLRFALCPHFSDTIVSSFRQKIFLRASEGKALK